MGAAPKTGRGGAGDPQRRWMTRREVLSAGAGVVVGGLLWPVGSALGASAFALDDAAKSALGSSPLVYVSPLQKSGAESSCHGEVWFFVDEGSVVIFTGSDGWKARAIAKGRDRARIWVGDFGPVGRAGDRYRKAPTFLARAEATRDRGTFDRLMASFAERYSGEWGKWGPRFQKGYDDGSRVLIRYTPIGA